MCRRQSHRCHSLTRFPRLNSLSLLKPQREVSADVTVLCRTVHPRRWSAWHARSRSRATAPRSWATSRRCSPRRPACGRRCGRTSSLPSPRAVGPACSPSSA
eukprot:4737288-Prymnesium_polylepis.1